MDLPKGPLGFKQTRIFSTFNSSNHRGKFLRIHAIQATPFVIMQSQQPPKRPRMHPHNTLRKCVLVAICSATVLTGRATAQVFEFEQTSAQVSASGRTENFSGPGPWSIFAHDNLYAENAWSWGDENAIVTGVQTDYQCGYTYAYAQSTFTVTEDVTATADWDLRRYGCVQGKGSLDISNLTDNIVLLTTDNSLGTVDLPLVAGKVYSFRAELEQYWGEMWAILSLPPVCQADFNDDGAVDSRDVIAFLNAWAAGDPRADTNGDGTVDTSDVLAFLNLWAAGC